MIEENSTEVTFVEKPLWQRNQCLFCEKPATLKAMAGKRAKVSCCSDESCKKQATALAQELNNFGK